MEERRELSEEEQQESLRRSRRFAQRGTCCFVAAGALILLLTWPEVVHLLRTAPSILGVDLMRWAINLLGLWGFSGSAWVLASASLSIQVKARRPRLGRE